MVVMADDAHLPGIAVLRLRRFRDRLGAPEEDVLAVEEPLEVRYLHRPVATLMRTPGDDRDLALGYLYGEGWIDRLRDVGALSTCGTGADRDSAPDGDPRRARESDRRNVADLIPSAAAAPPPDLRARAGTTSASCGVCGKRTIEEAMLLRPPPPVAAGGRAPRMDGAGEGLRLAPELIADLPRRLRERQDLFARTGALHAAGLFDPAGSLLAVREDIGRHNAVDKVVGHAFRLGMLPLRDVALQVSGRVSFEIVQKAYRAGIRVVCAVSGVSTLAVELAGAAGLTLVGFNRGGSFCVYTREERILRKARDPAP